MAEIKAYPVTTTYKNRAKVGDGKSVKVTVPQNTTITHGKFYLLDGYLGAATQDVVTGAGQTASLILQIEEAEYETDQILVTDAMAVGADIYWDSANNRFTETAAGNRYAGRVTAAKDANNVIWFVLANQVSDTMKQGAARTDIASANAAAAAASPPTKAEFDVVVTLVNETKTVVNDLLAKLRAAGIIAQ